MTDALEWSQQQAAMAGGGAFPGVGGAGPMRALGDILQALVRILPAFGGSTGPTAQAARIMTPFAVANAFASPGTPFVGAGTSELMGRAQLQMALSGGMTGMRGAGGGLPGGFGISPGMAGVMGAEMEAFRTPGSGGTTLDDLTGIAAGGAGFLGRGVTNVRQARERIRELTSTVLELQRELSMTVDETMQKLSAVRQMGFTSPRAAAGAVRSIMQTSAITGLPMEQTAGIMASHGQEWHARLQQSGLGISMQNATGMVQTGLGTIGGAVRSGMVSDEMLLNTTGAMGAEGTSRLLGRVQEMGNRFLRDPRANYMIAAAMDPTTMQLNQGMINRMMSGSMGAGEIQRLAEQNIQGLGPDALGQWRGMQSQLRGQFQEMTGGMGGLAIARTMLERYGVNIDPSDPGSVARFQAVTKTRDPMEAQTMMTLIQNWDVIQEEGRDTIRREERRQQSTAERNRRMQASSLESTVERSVRSYQEAVSAPFTRAAENLAAKVMRLTGAPQEIIYNAEEAARSSSFYEAARGVAARGGADQDFFSPESVRRGGAALLGEAAGIDDTGVRTGSVFSAFSALSSGRREAAAGFDLTSGFWGGRRSPGSREEIMSNLSARLGMTSEEVMVAGRRFRETQADRDAFLAQESSRRAALDGSGFTDKLAEMLPAYADEIRAGFKNRTLFDILAVVGDDELTNRVTAEVYKGQSAEAITALQRSTREAVAAARPFRGRGGGVGSIAELEIALGIRSERDDRTGAQHMEAARQRLGAAGVEERLQGQLISELQASPALLGQLFAATKGKSGTVDLASLIPGDLPEEQRARVGVLLTGTAKVEDFHEALRHTAAASVAEGREAILAEGWLGAGAAGRYRELQQRGRGPEAAFASRMLAARGAVESGDEGGGLAQAGSAIASLLDLDERAWQRVRGQLGDAVTASEVETIRRMQKATGGRDDPRSVARRGGRGGRDISVEELTGAGYDVGAVRKLAGLSEEDLTADRIGNADVQRKLVEAVSRMAVEIGKPGGTASGAEPAMNPMTQAIRDGFQQAITAQPLQVIIIEDKAGIGGKASRPAGSEDQID